MGNSDQSESSTPENIGKEERLLSVNDFLNEIDEEIKKGYRFTPFIGSGMSSNSGILMGEQFTEYLAYVFFRCVASQKDLNEVFDSDTSKICNWDIKTDGWPIEPNPKVIKKVKNWIREKYIEVFTAQYTEIIFKNDPNNDGLSLIPKLKKSESKQEVNFEQLNFISSINVPLCPEVLYEQADDNLKNHDENLRRLYKSFKSENLLRDHYPAPGILLNSKEYAIEAGIRSLFDWRATIRFLARMRLRNLNNGLSQEPDYEFSKEPDQTIIDSFNNHLVWNRKPNLSHFILASLVRPLRIRTWLTTNFDDLIEQALGEAKHPISVLEPGIKSDLPDPSLVHSENTLVKLHGGIIDTRADFTLDDPPELRELEQFSKYFCTHGTNNNYVPSQLLVMGFSGRDKRIIEFFKYTMQKNKGFKIYWIVYSEKDKDRLEESFPANFFEGKIKFVISKRNELLLYQLYQKLTLSLPPKTVPYEFIQYVPPFYDPYTKGFEDKVTTFTKEDTKEINIEDSKMKSYESILSNPEKGVCEEFLEKDGNTHAMMCLFMRLKQKRFQCAWIEQDEYASPQSIISKILRTLSIELGIIHREYVNIDIDIDEKDDVQGISENYISNLINMLAVSPYNWVFFIYGRNLAGSCSGWQKVIWTEEQYSLQIRMLETLAEKGFKIVYMPPDDKKLSSECQYVENTYTDTDTETQAKEKFKFYSDGYFSKMNNYKYPYSYNTVEPIDSAKDHGNEAVEKAFNNTFVKEVLSLLKSENQITKKEELKVHFLYATTLFRQSRHPCSLYSEAVYPCYYKFNNEEKDNDSLRAKESNLWLEKLSKDPQGNNLFQLKLGGYYWQFGTVRLGLQRALEFPRSLNLQGDGRIEYSLVQRRAKTHFWIGDWYLKAFHSISHPTPLIESIYHRIAAINFAKYAKPTKLNINPDSADLYREIELILQYRAQLVESSLSEITKALRISKTTINFWMQGSHGSSLFNKADMSNAIGLQSNFGELNPETIKSWLCETISTDNFAGQEEKGYAKKFANSRDLLINNIVNLLHCLKIEIDETYKLLHHATGDGRDLIFNSTVDFTATSSSNDCFTEKYHSTISNIKIYEYPEKELETMESDFIKAIESVLGAKEEESFKQLFSSSKEKKSAELKQDITVIKQQWAQALSDKNDELVILTKLIAEFAYFKVRSAKLQSRIETLTCIDSSRSNQLWIQVCMLCWLGQDLLKNAHPNFLPYEYRIKFRFLSFYGLALANLGRFYEAHRRYNEANAYIESELESVKGSNLAILRLRRTETHILIAEKIHSLLALLKIACHGTTDTNDDNSQYSDILNHKSPKSCALNTFLKKIYNYDWYKSKLLKPSILRILDDLESNFPLEEKKEELAIEVERMLNDNALLAEEMECLERIYASKVEDAVTSLETTEILLSKHDRSRIWWGNLYLFKLILLRLGAEKDIRFKSLVFRRKLDYVDLARKVFGKGYLVSNRDPYQKLRLIHEFSHAIHKMAQNEQLKQAHFPDKNNVIRETLRDYGLAFKEQDQITIDCLAGLIFQPETCIDSEKTPFNDGIKEYMRLVTEKLNKFLEN